MTEMHLDGCWRLPGHHECAKRRILNLEEEVRSLPHNVDRLEVACEIVRAIRDHMVDGGSYRHLIYGRMGFGMEAYGPIYEAGGMDVSNACPVNLDKEVFPRFSWAGAGVVESVHEGTYRTVSVRFDDTDARWEPEATRGKVVTAVESPDACGSLSKGDIVLCVYFSGSWGGHIVAYPKGLYIAAHVRGEEKK